jgi:polar amino acid transport system substrate-binding protein
MAHRSLRPYRLHALFSALFLCAAIGQAQAQQIPAPGSSPRIDAIKKAGVLRVAVLSNAPWLVENTTGGSGEAWQGPAWMLAKQYAQLLGVKVQPVLVSHETKVPVLAANQADMSITPLVETAERLKVVDFVLYSANSTCLFGRADNPKFANAGTVDALNKADITVAYFTGGGEENWVKRRFSSAQLRGVFSSGAAAPVEEIMAKRADVAPVNRLQWSVISKKVKGLAVLPKENNCQDSTELSSPVGLAVDKGQTVFVEWLRAVAKPMEAGLKADEQRVVNTLMN